MIIILVTASGINNVASKKAKSATSDLLKLCKSLLTKSIFILGFGRGWKTGGGQYPLLYFDRFVFM